MYKTLDDAAPMLRAYNILTGSDRVLKEEDLPTFGKEFFNTFLHTDYTIKRRKGMSMESSDMPLADMIGRWAYFQDIAMQGGAEMAFGKIMGVRNTNQWMGNKYFLSNNISTSMQEISNATAYFMPFNMPSQFDFTESETIICSEYLNTYCTYLKDGVMKKGKVFSFNEKEINIRSADGDKDTVLFENRSTDILEHADEVEDLVMAITIIKNQG
jgi:hypothetical protein